MINSSFNDTLSSESSSSRQDEPTESSDLTPEQSGIIAQNILEEIVIEALFSQLDASEETPTPAPAPAQDDLDFLFSGFDLFGDDEPATDATPAADGLDFFSTGFDLFDEVETKPKKVQPVQQTEEEQFLSNLFGMNDLFVETPAEKKARMKKETAARKLREKEALLNQSTDEVISSFPTADRDWVYQQVKAYGGNKYAAASVIQNMTHNSMHWKRNDGTVPEIELSHKNKMIRREKQGKVLTEIPAIFQKILNTSEKSEPARQILTTHLPHSHGPYSLLEQIQKEHMFPHGLTILCGLGANLETQEDLDSTLLMTMRRIRTVARWGQAALETGFCTSPLVQCADCLNWVVGIETDTDEKACPLCLLSSLLISVSPSHDQNSNTTPSPNPSPSTAVTFANPHTSTVSLSSFAGLPPYTIEQAEKATQRRHITMGLVEKCECPQCHEILDGTLKSGSLRPKNNDSTLQTLPSTIKVCPHQNCQACICEFCGKVVGSHHSIAQDHLCQEMIELAKTEIQKEVAKIKITSESHWACPKCSKPRFAEGQTEFSHNDRWNRRICECGCVWCGVCEKELVADTDGLWNVFAHFGDEGCPMTMKADTLEAMNEVRKEAQTKGRLFGIVKEFKIRHPQFQGWDLSLKELQDMVEST
ncbi:hypothetical protein BLNAU_4251 [Blattamonas nauphoetae]|uniref:RING-type domain-containing protein n=1 Tax=Blattamonas nauphoetae TaxID=2049346 RepID=A0ABQ9YAX0_9EUKA|nr:hypothetical protein BLNAU_4251 [Blattamonas nauphoetae]